MKRSFLLFGILIFFQTAYPALIQWKIENGGNGHFYEVIYYPPVIWGHAYSLCQDEGGYLVTITSLEEQAFIEALMVSNDMPTGGYWIGLYEHLQNNNWRWTTGEPVVYTNWFNDEPNNLGGNEDRGQILWSRYTDDPYAYRRGTWNDLSYNGNYDSPIDTHNVGYIIEYGSYCGDIGFPRPVGDLNGDCIVNLADLALLSQNWLECTKPECD